MTLISGHQHLHDEKGQHIGDVCGAPYSDRQFSHTKSCPRRAKPFMRSVISEFGCEYLCHGCKRAWAVSEWGSEHGNEWRMEMPSDWWGWQLAKGLALQADGTPFWAQDWGRGKAHFLWVGKWPACGYVDTMYDPFPVAGEATFCKSCTRIVGT